MNDPIALARESAARIAADMPTDGWKGATRSTVELIAESAQSAWEADALLDFEEAFGEDAAEEIMERSDVAAAFRDTYTQVVTARLEGAVTGGASWD